MFNALTRRQNRLEEANIFTKEKAKRLAEEIKTVSIERLKLSEELAVEKTNHVETAKVLEKAFLDLKEAKSALTEA